MKNIYALWGRNPAFYSAATFITFMGKEHELRSAAVQRLELKKGDTVLDIACGTGLNFSYLEAFVGKKGKIVGIDYSKSMLYGARNFIQENSWENVKLKHADATQLGEDDLKKVGIEGKVDAIISVLGMSAIPEHEKAITAAYELLKPGGKMVVMDGNPFKESGLIVFNPLLKLVYKHLSNWDYNKNIINDMRKTFIDVDIEEHNSGTIYIASAIKH